MLDTMSFSAVILVLSMMNFSLAFASGCDKSCADKPVFSPSQLVVKYGDPASATCSVCKHECHGNYYNIEHSVGEVEYNKTMLYWKTDNLTEWDPTLTCYYNNASDHQCCTLLPVTLYKPPDKVSFSFGDHTGPVVTGNMYTFRCTLENVAPFEKVQAVFYKGDNAFGQAWSNQVEDKKPLTKFLELDFIPLEGDNGAEYWCEAEFRLESEGQQPLPVVRSQRTTAIVYYEPEFQVLHDSRWYTITEGDRLQLSCISGGNPSPTYNWTLPSGRVSSSMSGVFIIESAAAEHEGMYTCIVSNGYGTLKDEFQVTVRANYIGYIIAGILALVVLLILFGVFIYFRYYKHNRMGRYNLLDVLRLRTRHSAVPTAEGI